MVEDMEVDVLVVGGGPAGAYSAKSAAENGARTLLIEKRQEIGAPVRCGEGLARAWMQDIGLEPDPMWIEHEVDGVAIIAPDGTRCLIDARLAGNETGYVISRERFDKALIRQAGKAGARIMMKTAATAVLKDDDGTMIGVKARHMGEEFEIRAKVTIACDGVECMLARWAGLEELNVKPKDYMSSLQYTLVGIEGDHRYNEFYIGKEVAPGGYVWVFWKGEGIANVGIGIQGSLCEKQGGTARKYLDRFIEGHPRYSKGKPVEQVAGGVPVCEPPEKVIAPGLLVVGDAARMVDALTGGGISSACQAGQIAGRVAAETAAEGDVSEERLEEYEDLWRDKLESQLLRNYIAKELFIDIEDEDFNILVGLLAEQSIGVVSTKSVIDGVLEAVEEKYPELAEKLAELF